MLPFDICWNELLFYFKRGSSPKLALSIHYPLDFHCASLAEERLFGYQAKLDFEFSNIWNHCYFQGKLKPQRNYRNHGCRSRIRCQAERNGEQVPRHKSPRTRRCGQIKEQTDENKNHSAAQFWRRWRSGGRRWLRWPETRSQEDFVNHGSHLARSRQLLWNRNVRRLRSGCQERSGSSSNILLHNCSNSFHTFR